MTRTKKDESDAPIDLFETAGLDEVENALQGLPTEESKIYLYRVKPPGRPAFIQSFTPDSFDIDAIKQTYGGGKFQIIVRANGERRAPMNFEIDSETKIGGPISKYRKYDEYGRLVFVTEDELNKPEKSNGGLPSDSVTMLLLQELKSLREAIQVRPIDTESVKKNFLEEMLVFKQLFSPGQQQNPMQDFSKVAIDLIKQGMEVANLSENGGSPWMIILDKILPTVQDALKVVASNQTRVQRPPMAPISQNPEQAQLPQSGEVPVSLTGFDAIAVELQPYLPMFLRAASAGTDPGVLVDLALPQISQDKHQIIIEWFEGNNWFQDLQKLHPLIIGQAAYWGEFRALMLEALKNPQGEQGEHEE